MTGAGDSPEAQRRAIELLEANHDFPGDFTVSVIARNDDAFMSALLPEPTRYHASPHVIARRVFKLLMQVVDGETPLRLHVRIMPAFIAGESLSMAPGASPAT